MADRSHNLAQVGVYSLLEQRFLDLALGYPVTRQERGWTETPSLAELEKRLGDFYTVSRARSAYGDASWLGTDEDIAVHVTLDTDGSWQVSAAGTRALDVLRALEQLTAVLPRSEPRDDSIPVRFWALGPMGPISYQRRLDAAGWDEVATNYPLPPAMKLKQLMSLDVGEATGRLLLWHGVAGTGKTHAIRALTAAWQPWCDVDYVVDADEFFDHAHYMISTLVMNEDPLGDRWRLVVIEDAGEFLTADAHSRTGQGLSRLLNLTDGLVGQGLRLLVLMTTNEPAEELHPAVTRPGRCLTEIEFTAFDPQAAGAWLLARGVEGVMPEGPETLAQLYARLKVAPQPQLAEVEKGA